MFNSDKRILARLNSVQPIKLDPSEPGMPVTMRCGVSGCTLFTKTHIVDVVWEMDPDERDRRWVRLEMRCENGHGFVVLLRNRGGETRIESAFLDDVVSPFAEGARW